VDARAAARLLDWFAAARRDLPWRGPFPRDPYRVLVSEVMLQQTQVKRVREGFVSFVARFPDVEALAAAAVDDVVAAFSGMGYYGRARRLHAAARAVVERGVWPRTTADLSALPGVGAYTAAAAAAFAFGSGDPPVDGNVGRVAARLLALPLATGSAALERRSGELARELYNQAPRPEVYEALMELGATVCTPAAPRCHACPLAASCRGLGEPARYPLPRTERATVDVQWAALWLQREDGRVLLRRVPEGRLLAGLWLPPLAGLATGEDAADVAAMLASEVGFAGRIAPTPRVRHSITHHRIEVVPYSGDWPTARVAEALTGAVFHDPAAPGVPTSSLLAKLAGVCSGPRQRAAEELLRERD
jgi:A/G-specific adenine glycosylase